MEINLFGKQFFMNKTLLFCVLIILVLGSGFLGYFLKQVYMPLSSTEIEESQTNIIKSEEVSSLDKAKPSEELEKVEEEPEIKVYVIGCVNKPGVVTIKKGQVIDDAIKMAGGATLMADLENINLAYIINENTMLRIKSKEANVISNEAIPNKAIPKASSNKEVTKNNPKSGGSQQKSKTATNSKIGTIANTNKLNSGVDIVSDSLGCVVEEDTKGKEENNLININKASQAELEGLPNVGPATAKAIITYREKNGGFKKLTDIMKITGIKQKTYDKIKDFICI